MIKPRLLHSYIQSPEWYNELYDKITKEQAEEKEAFVREIGFNPTPERLQEFKDLLIKEHKKEFSEDEVRDAFRALFTYGSIAMSVGVKKYRDERKEKRIKEWIKEAKAKNRRILGVTPFDNVKCIKCRKVMDYEWSDLHEEGTFKKPVSRVMFFYECPDKCERKIVFEDGSPWVTKKDNKCPACQGERKITVTKDKENNMFYIHECLSCGSKQVENF